jgi:hypothetical protein
MAVVCGWATLAGSLLMVLTSFKGEVFFTITALFGIALAGFIFCGCAAVERMGRVGGLIEQTRHNRNSIGQSGPFRLIIWDDKT